MGRTIPLFLMIFSVACGGRNVPKSADAGDRKEVRTEILSSIRPVPGEQYRPGDTVFFGYSLFPGDDRPDSVFLRIGQQEFPMETDHPFILAADYPVGVTEFRITAYQGGERTVVPGDFTVLPTAVPAAYGYRVVRTFDHDRTAYTQGLFWHEGLLYESTGMEGRSSLRKVDPESGAVLKKIDLDDRYFGEGIALLDGKIYMLTWKHNIGFVYDLDFRKIDEFGYQGEGWGLTSDGRWLYMSNGSEKIYRIDPERFGIVETIQVYSDQGKVVRLNELEWIEGEIWANVYLTDQIVRIDPSTGAVTGLVDLKGILKSSDKDMTTDVLNGIAYDAETKKIYVTGKNWSRLFEIAVVRQ